MILRILDSIGKISYCKKFIQVKIILVSLLDSNVKTWSTFFSFYLKFIKVGNLENILQLDVT